MALKFALLILTLIFVLTYISLTGKSLDQMDEEMRLGLDIDFNDDLELPSEKTNKLAIVNGLLAGISFIFLLIKIIFDQH